jgi:hypothetical protein
LLPPFLYTELLKDVSNTEVMLFLKNVVQISAFCFMFMLIYLVCAKSDHNSNFS